MAAPPSSKRARGEVPRLQMTLIHYRLLVQMTLQQLAVMSAFSAIIIAKDVGRKVAMLAIAQDVMDKIRTWCAVAPPADPTLLERTKRSFGAYKHALGGPHEREHENFYWDAAAALAIAARPKGRYWRLLLARGAQMQTEALSALVDAHEYGEPEAGEPAFMAAGAARAGYELLKSNGDDRAAWVAMRGDLMQAHNLCFTTRHMHCPRTTFLTLWVDTLGLALSPVLLTPNPPIDVLVLAIAPPVYFTCDITCHQLMVPTELLMLLLTNTALHAEAEQRVKNVAVYVLRLARDCPRVDDIQARFMRAHAAFLASLDAGDLGAVYAATSEFMLPAFQLWCAAVDTVEMVTRGLHASLAIAARFRVAPGGDKNSTQMVNVVAFEGAMRTLMLLLREKLDAGNVRATSELAARACSNAARLCLKFSQIIAAEWDALAHIFKHMSELLRKRREDAVIMPPPLCGYLLDAERMVEAREQIAV